jgi:hypothetical protein
MQRWVERPEARWALWAGIIGALAAAGLSTRMILSHGSSTAALGFIMLPLVAAAAAVPIAVWGAALGHVVAHLRGRAHEPKIVFWVALLAALSVPLAAGYTVWQGKSLERAVQETRAMEGTGLERAFQESPFRRDKYFLGALAEHPAARAPLLDAIASLEDPGLFEPMWSLWDVMGENRKGLAVMRLVARHRNAAGATLERLAAHPESGKLITELLANPSIPAPVLARYHDSTDYRAEWGLALNPKTPPAVMDRLARGGNLYARLNLALYNPATPHGVLELLSKDADSMVAQRARERLKRP